MLHFAASYPMTNAPEFERWFDAGSAVFNGSTDPADFPPLDDRDAQRYWLGGFGAAWADCPPGTPGWCAERIEVVLMLALIGRDALAEQLQGHGRGRLGCLH